MKKILLCNEASIFNTGYSKYGRDLMNTLYKTGKYELAEFAVVADPDNPEHVSEMRKFPWKHYFNTPSQKLEPERFNQFKSNHNFNFGSFSFESVCLNFKPDIVVSFRDFWMDVFICNSPFKRIYKHAWMPTCDAQPQKIEWLSEFKKTDAIFTYTDWSKKILKESGINVLNSCPPSCSNNFVPRDKKLSKKLLGIDENTKVIGTVMRNQRRKLFDDYFQAIRKYIDKYEDGDSLFLCHTSYPDRGWDFPELIIQHGLSSRVIFTYICQNCNSFFLSFWSDALRDCPKCNNISCTLPSVKNGLNELQLSYLYSCMDVYVQYANSEGFGVPQIEAAACGTPIMAVNYSAMEDVLDKLNGVKLEPLGYLKEIETGCYRAITNNEIFSDKLYETLNSKENLGLITRSLFEQNYNAVEIAERWMRYFDSTEVADWSIAADIQKVPELLDSSRLSNSQFVKWLILNVIKDENMLGSYFEYRITKNLNCGQSLDGFFQLYNRYNAYQECVNIRNNRNFWENQRSLNQ